LPGGKDGTLIIKHAFDITLITIYANANYFTCTFVDGSFAMPIWKRGFTSFATLDFDNATLDGSRICLNLNRENNK
jgi:hypothetical protein